MSDLHLEFGEQFLPENAGTDVLILAGDIITVHGIRNTKSKRRRYTEFFQHVSDNWKDVIYVIGNHEWYKAKHPGVVTFLKGWVQANWKNVHLLENETVQIGETVFVGGTLWTDFFRGNPLAKIAVARGMNDYSVAPLTPDMTERFHARTRDYISWTAKNADRVVVVSHHAPSHLSSLPQYVNDPLNAGYCSNMEEFILDHPSIMAWVHGHMHNSSDYMIGTCRVLANPRGYPHELNSGFDMLKKVCY